MFPQTLLLLFAALSVGASSLKSPGDTLVVPGWQLQSSLQVSGDLAELSLPGRDVDSWYRVGRRSTVMAGLIASDVYNDTRLFYSENLNSVDLTTFKSPWLYRAELTLEPPPTDQHIFLVTHGITSKADIYFNGQKIVGSEDHQGAFAGHRFDITPHIRAGSNVLLIQAHPTNYLRDFAQGFVDWNPYPPDNGTGVWRDVELKRTGPVSVSSPRILTDYKGSDTDHLTVLVKVDTENHGQKALEAIVHGIMLSENGTQVSRFAAPVQLQPRKKVTVSMHVPLQDPEIWWPAAWGKQPLYTVQLRVTIQEKTTDVTPLTKFGIRHVTSRVNAHNDTEFSVNGHRFHVKSAGYSPDMFLRFDIDRVQTIFQYMLDMGLNTIRLEGKPEHPELYDLADRMGLMVISGWECCDKWEGWDYNTDANGVKWTEKDYPIAEAQMLHEADMIQTHPSMLGFILGSDFWPNDRASKVFVDAMRRMDWPNPIIASASKRGYPEILGPSGMKMDGPYDWVPPNYWYGSEMGAAFGFGSEQGAGVGTPEMSSLKRFMSSAELETLWRKPEKGLYHMAKNDSVFYYRKIYNKGLFERYGQPTGLDDYVRKAQMMDYEATRAEFEGFAIRQNASRPATGVVYWMLNSAWPNLHWQLFDYYLQPLGSYFGTKIGARQEHVAYDYEAGDVYLINHLPQAKGKRHITVDLIDLNGKSLLHQDVTVDATPLASKVVAKVNGQDRIKDVAFLRLLLDDVPPRRPQSRNIYWLSTHNDVLDWTNSTWYTTPVTKYADFTALSKMKKAAVSSSMNVTKPGDGITKAIITLDNKSDIPAFFIRLAVVDKRGQDVAPVYWSDNYITLFPKEKIDLSVEFEASEWSIEVSGGNVDKSVLDRH